MTVFVWVSGLVGVQTTSQHRQWAAKKLWVFPFSEIIFEGNIMYKSRKLMARAHVPIAILETDIASFSSCICTLTVADKIPSLACLSNALVKTQQR